MYSAGIRRPVRLAELLGDRIEPTGLAGRHARHVTAKTVTSSAVRDGGAQLETGSTPSSDAEPAATGTMTITCTIGTHSRRPSRGSRRTRRHRLDATRDRLARLASRGQPAAARAAASTRIFWQTGSFLTARSSSFGFLILPMARVAVRDLHEVLLHDHETDAERVRVSHVERARCPSWSSRAASRWPSSLATTCTAERCTADDFATPTLPSSARKVVVAAVAASANVFSALRTVGRIGGVAVGLEATGRRRDRRRRTGLRRCTTRWRSPRSTRSSRPTPPARPR